jgi:hypothetical protein
MIGFIEKHHKLLLEKKKEDGVSENAPKKLSKKDLEIDPDVDDAPEDDENKTKDSSNPELENIIISFFQDTDNITDDDIDKLAEIIGIDHETLEEKIFAMFKTFVSKGKNKKKITTPSEVVMPDEEMEESTSETIKPQKPGPRYTFFSLNRGPESDKFFPEETKQERIKKMMQDKLATNPYYRSDEKH